VNPESSGRDSGAAPLVSVAIPAYKAPFLEEAIRSVLDQTWERFELIIVNDASPDDLHSIVSGFDDPRIQYFENRSNLGAESLVRNWNRCLSYARGEFFAVFSDDDRYHPQFLERLIKLASEHPGVDLYHTGVRVIDHEGREKFQTPACPRWEPAPEFILRRIRDGRNQYAPEFMCRRRRLVEMGGFVDFPLAWCSDDATWFSLAVPGGVACVDEALCDWRYSDWNISRVGRTDQRLEAIRQFDTWLRQFLEALESDDSYKLNMIEEIRRCWPRRRRILQADVLSKCGDTYWTGIYRLARIPLQRGEADVSLRAVLLALLLLLRRGR